MSRVALMAQSDERLVELVREGSEAAYEVLVKRHTPQLLNYCKRFVDHDQANDVVQHSLISVYALITSTDREVRVGPWLHRTAQNRAIDMLRKADRRDESIDDLFPSHDETDALVQTRHDLRNVVATINELPARQREALLMLLDGKSHEQIARAMGGTMGAVNQLLIRARRRVRDGLGAVIPLALLRWTERGHLRVLPDSRVAEIAAGGASGAGALKIGATVLAAGTLLVGGSTTLTTHGDSQIDSSAKTALAPQAAGSGGVSPATTLEARHRTVRNKPLAPAGSKPSHSGDPDPAPAKTVVPPKRLHPLPGGKSGGSPTRPGATKSGPGATTATTSSVTSDPGERLLTLKQDPSGQHAADYRINSAGDPRAISIIDASGSGIDGSSAGCVHPGSDPSRLDCPTHLPDGQTYRQVAVFGGNMSDRIEETGALFLVAYGAAGDDHLIGGDQGDLLHGDEGADWIEGGAGADTIVDSADMEDANEADRDRIDGGAGPDMIIGGAGNDILDGGSGSDLLADLSGDDQIIGGPGDDSVSGGPGNDIVIGGSGLDLMWGDAGNDTVLARDGQADLVVSCGDDTGGDRREVDPFDPDDGAAIPCPSID